MLEKIKIMALDIAKKMKKNGEDDPRRMVHSIKVGIALTLMSLFYYFRPLYHGFGQAGMWAILTVVVVFEFSVGGTISKGVNRGAATLVAAGLGVGAELLANKCGDKGEPILLALMVFVLAGVLTFVRFFPHVKRKYDYGVMVFILTFSLVAVSGARASEIWKMAHQRLTTILIGGATCMAISLCICPVWAGQDLHNLIAANIEKLASFLQAFSDQSCLPSASPNAQHQASMQAYKTVLNSKANEETLANFAWWELGHGRFKFIHPWKLYLNIGGVVRQCACQIETLYGCINSRPQAQAQSQVAASEFQQKIQPACVKLSTESGEALKELAAAIKNMTFPSPDVEIHLQNSEAAADELKSIMENSCLPKNAPLQDIVSILVVASVLIEILKFVKSISVSVNELSQKAGFKEFHGNAATASDRQQTQVLHRGIVKPVDDDQVVIDVVEIKAEDSTQIKNLVHPTQG